MAPVAPVREGPLGDVRDGLAARCNPLGAPRPAAPPRPGVPPAPVGMRHADQKGAPMLWLILGIILLVIAIAGGVIIHPILFVIAILALVMFLMRTRYA
jgi:hypothetical protein